MRPMHITRHRVTDAAEADAKERLAAWVAAFEEMAAACHSDAESEPGKVTHYVEFFSGNGRAGLASYRAAGRYAIRQGHVERALGTGHDAPGLPKMLALKDIHHYREGGSSPTGNPAEIDTPKTGRCRCRCCGERIAKDEVALMIPMRWADNNSAYHTDAVWVHLDCDPIRVKRIEQANF